MNFEHTIDYKKIPFIRIQERGLSALQDLLNTICVYPSIEKILSEFRIIQDMFPDLDELVENKYHGYWYDDRLGKSFTVLGYDNGIDVFINGSTVYVEDGYQLSTVPRVELSLNEFISVLEEWRDILKSSQGV